MKVSVIIPTYNRAQILPLCLNSLANQDYPKTSFEVIVVDNNSSDNTKEVVTTYINRFPDVSIKYLHEKKPGSGYARNKGVIHACHETIAFSDDDAIFHTDWLTEICKAFKGDDRAVAIAGKIIVKWDKKPPDWIYPYEFLLGKLDYGETRYYDKGIYINLGNFIIKKELLVKLGGVSRGITGKYLMDNSEDGINLKLKKHNYIIGWAPNAIMEHYQLVNRNATVSDIKRRYRNLGITTPYRIYIENKNYYKLFINLLRRCKSLIVQSMVYIFSAIILPNRKKRLHSVFLITYAWAQIYYSFKLVFNYNFRKLLIEEESTNQIETSCENK